MLKQPTRQNLIPGVVIRNLPNRITQILNRTLVKDRQAFQ